MPLLIIVFYGTGNLQISVYLFIYLLESATLWSSEDEVDQAGGRNVTLWEPLLMAVIKKGGPERGTS